MAADPVDVLVIGGGITGAGIARDAAMRGMRTALVDMGDWASGTSSRSSRLVHGGLRYLEQGDLHLVFESTHERRVLLRLAPHLVRPLPFLLPVYRGTRVAAWKLRAGMWVYDALAAFRNVHMHRWLPAKEVARVEPRLRAKGLKGAALYYDAQVDDARLVLANVRAASQAGALVANHADATSLLKSDGRVRGAVVRDVITGEQHSVRALLVVNAAGPWCDAVRRKDESDTAPLLRLTRGAHVVVPRARLGNTHAITLFSPIDGRVMFVLPWGDLSYVGTTDTDDAGAPGAVRATGEDVVYLLRSANALFPDARLTVHDVISTWAGLRALLAPDGNRTASQVSREHRVAEGTSGMITIAGGKLTTYRRMARDVVDRVAQELHELDGRPEPRRAATERVPLPGGEAADLEILVHSLEQRDVPEIQARHLVAHYGSEAAAVRNLAERDRTLDEPILPNRPEIWAEVVYAVEREMAIRLSDVLIRRLHLFYEDPAHGSTISTAVADRLAERLGWDQARRDSEVADYTAEVKRARAFLRETSRTSRETAL